MFHTAQWERRALSPFLAVTLSALAALNCNGDSPESQIAREIRRGAAALRAEDIEPFLDQIAPEKLPPDSAAAAIALDNIRRNIEAQWLRTETRSLAVTLDSVQATGDTAIVSTTLHWDRIIDAAGRKDTVISDVKHREVWRKTPKGWRSITMLSSNGTNSINGKVEEVRQ